MLDKGDFHIHSTASDGDLTPSEIIILAKERSIDTISITDHNTVNGIDEAINFGKRYGVAIIPAVELSTRYKGESIHILGYFKNTNYNDINFIEILKLIKTHKIKKARRILSNFVNLDSSEGHLSVVEGISLLKAFNAAVVLAHPVRISRKNLKEILNLPFDGIEAKYGYSSFYETNYFINIALKCFSFYTGGSDFHTNKRNDHKHSLIGEPYLNSSEIERFLEKSGALLIKPDI